MLAGLNILAREEGKPTHCGVVKVGRGSWFACREGRVKDEVAKWMKEMFDGKMRGKK